MGKQLKSNNSSCFLILIVSKQTRKYESVALDDSVGNSSSAICKMNSDEILALKKKIDRNQNRIDSEIVKQLFHAYKHKLTTIDDREMKEQLCVDLLNVIDRNEYDTNDRDLRLTIKSILYWFV